MKINVTKLDIIRGKKGSCSRCPIAIAVGRAFHEEKVAVDGLRVYIYKNIKSDVYTLPAEAVEFIFRFDAGDKGLKPFSFEI